MKYSYLYDILLCSVIGHKEYKYYNESTIKIENWNEISECASTQ